jgi:hypothetical protein
MRTSIRPRSGGATSLASSFTSTGASHDLDGRVFGTYKLGIAKAHQTWLGLPVT